MDTKLTLRLSSSLIKRAKVYAKKHGKSVSKLVGDYFSVLNQAAEKEQFPSLPLTNSLHGVLKGTHVSEKDYKKHLEDKYL